MNNVQSSPVTPNWISDINFPHSAEEAKEEFLSVPEHYQGCVEEALDTIPPHPDRSYYIFRKEEAGRLGVARVQHERGNAKIFIDTFTLDSETGIYSFVSTELFDKKASTWVQQASPHFLSPEKRWLCLGELREDYGMGREIPEERVDEIYALHDQVVLEQDPPCFYNQTDFNSNVEAALSAMRELENAAPGTFTVLGDEIHPTRYKLCFINQNREFIMKKFTISSDAKYHTEDGSFAAFSDVKTHYNLTSPISTDFNDSDSEIGD